jgi:hypothetical protein
MSKPNGLAGRNMSFLEKNRGLQISFLVSSVIYNQQFFFQAFTNLTQILIKISTLMQKN